MHISSISKEEQTSNYIITQNICRPSEMYRNKKDEDFQFVKKIEKNSFEKLGIVKVS